jgi:hypothetical protein
VASKIHASLFAFFCSLALVIGSASASMVLPLGLDRLHGDAKVVFLGECLSNSVEMDQQSGRVVTYTTFQVLETYKGNIGSSYTIKQIGGNLPGANLNVRMPGVPQFEVGQRYVVFLPPASRLGFSSPVGLSQGKFTVKTDATGVQVVSNGRDVGDLMENMAQSKIPNRVADKLRAMPDRTVPANSKARAEMDLDDLRSVLRGMQ